MDTLKEYQNPSKLLVAFMDSIDEPVCLVDDTGNCILNQYAKDLKDLGLEVDKLSVKLKNNTSSIVNHKGKKYNISGYPTVKILKDDGSDMEYDGGRTLEGMKKFLVVDN